MNKSYNNATPKIVGTVAMLAILAVGTYVVLGNNKEEASTIPTKITTTTVSKTESVPENLKVASQSSTDTQPAATGQATGAESSVAFQDGEYTATANYTVPGGDTNSLTVVMSIKDGQIISAKSTSKYAERESAQYIKGFESNLSGAVVGKKLDSISLVRIGGASLTTQAFKDIISTVKKDAQS